ncbi:hypothetical protein RJ640_027143 [Escallonia rubra]|uniref:CRM domain-containing protein n=1 Tax=Escallonia rubra TaxID=112253 RepID=A0AA88QJL8_9ASTE|nr:hypothetical protein RJ640_027143 [Escallonia rubra]
MIVLIGRLSRQKRPYRSLSSTRHRFFSTAAAAAASSNLRQKYSFHPPPSLHQNPNPNPKPLPEKKQKKKPPYKPPSSLDRSGAKPVRSSLPFDFRFSYTESSQSVRPIGLREPKYSPFGPERLDRAWTGVCAPAVDPKVGSVEEGKEDPNLEEKRRVMRAKIQGEPLTGAERKALVEKCQRNRTKRQINLGRDGLTHNMLNDIHNNWKSVEAVRIKCMGVPTVDMKNVCAQLEDKTFGAIVQRHGGLLVLYRGRNYSPRKTPVIPLMLWKPQEPVYPRLIKTTIDGLSIEETKITRKRGLNAPAMTKLAKNGYYGSLVPMVRDAFLTSELVRIDCQGLDKSDYKKIGCKLRVGQWRNMAAAAEGETKGEGEEGAGGGGRERLVVVAGSLTTAAFTVSAEVVGMARLDNKSMFIDLELKDLVPCVLVTFDKEQIVIWRGKDYVPGEDGYFLKDRETFDNQDGDLDISSWTRDNPDNSRSQIDFDSGEE